MSQDEAAWDAIIDERITQVSITQSGCVEIWVENGAHLEIRGCVGPSVDAFLPVADR